jgi:hypothetical protein
LAEGNVPTARINGELEPATGCVEHFLRELKFRLLEALVIGLGRGFRAAKTSRKCRLRGVGKAGLEGGGPSGPVELRGEPANGTDGPARLRGDGTEGAPALEAQICDKSGKVSRGFVRLTLPEGHRLKIYCSWLDGGGLPRRRYVR